MPARNATRPTPKQPDALSTNVSALQTSVAAQDVALVQQKSLNELFSFVDDLLASVVLWKNFADAVDQEYGTAWAGHTTALKLAKKNVVRTAQENNNWKRSMCDALMFTLGSFGGGVAGKLLGKLATFKSVGGLVSSKESPTLFGGIDALGKELEKSGVQELANQFRPTEPVDVFTAVTRESANDQLSFLPPIIKNTDALIRTWRSLKSHTEAG